MMQVLRRWKRDGSVNFMSMEAGCVNIKAGAFKPEIRQEDVGEIQKRLTQGELIETRHAYFSAFVSSTQENVTGHLRRSGNGRGRRG